MAELAIGKHRLELAEARENAGAGLLRQAVCDEAEHLLSGFDFWCGIVRQRRVKIESPREFERLRLRSGTRRYQWGASTAMMSVVAAFVSSCGQPRRTTALPAAFVSSPQTEYLR